MVAKRRVNPQVLFPPCGRFLLEDLVVVGIRSIVGQIAGDDHRIGMQLGNTRDKSSARKRVGDVFIRGIGEACIPVGDDRPVFRQGGDRQSTASKAGSYAQIVSTDPKENRVTVQKLSGEQVTYDPSRLRGISAYREIEREFAIGDRIQWTAPSRELGVANRDLGTSSRSANTGE